MESVHLLCPESTDVFIFVGRGRVETKAENDEGKEGRDPDRSRRCDVLGPAFGSAQERHQRALPPAGAIARAPVASGRRYGRTLVERFDIEPFPDFSAK